MINLSVAVAIAVPFQIKRIQSHITTQMDRTSYNVTICLAICGGTLKKLDSQTRRSLWLWPGMVWCKGTKRNVCK